MNNTFDIIVVGGGHAGLEAAFASARLGSKTLLLTLNIKMMGNMPCNPSIGGSAKGIVVREIDALGGMMGIAADHEYLQMKMLNTSKGPGVQCLRAQADKITYPRFMQELALKTDNLTVLEGMVIELIHDDQTIKGVKTSDGRSFYSRAVILATGTYMESEILIGHSKTSGGPDGELPSLGLSENLRSMGIEIYRLKTGTPQRIKKDSIDFSKSEPQYGTPEKLAFSYETTTFVPIEEQLPCYLTYTTPKTHLIINEHLEDSSLYSGLVKGVGPRYCPSIEDKIVKFADKQRHQLFLEPESKITDSIYLQGFSTSMPKDVQIEMVHSLPGFEKAEILKYAYAIEYDAIKTEEYDATLMIKKWPGLYVSGQICGTSGYEEAAGLGLMAGINATFRLQNKEPLILRRDQSYIGVMIDDLITKGTEEPYRLMSSRAEFRLLLRHDNADFRLTEIGYKIGLISEERYKKFKTKKEKVDRVIEISNTKFIGKRKPFVDYLISLGFNEVKGGTKASEILKRPGVTYRDLIAFVPDLKNIPLEHETVKEVETMVKYEGYIANQIKEAKNMAKLDEVKLPPGIDYLKMDGLALEARSKLAKIGPRTIGQASRISGVNPADIAILLMNIKRRD
ncbi:MAG: tRNA uridine-5-carboxymethylaminomethyl(34) synthesis enzyme MnmG [Erysipelotrichia bacterium]|nr:tRNA uridine-5-carboxymethylaminomethyl(34) synthesis enzyme MnmG [Erysipelotrichia bacterium]